MIIILDSKYKSVVYIFKFIILLLNILSYNNEEINLECF